MVPFFSDSPRDARREERREESQERIPLIVACKLVKMTRSSAREAYVVRSYVCRHVGLQRVLEFPIDVALTSLACARCDYDCVPKVPLIFERSTGTPPLRACIDHHGNRVDQHAAGVPESG